MLFFILRIDKDIIDENYYELDQFWHEYRIHQIHKVSRSIYQSKGYGKILEQAITSRESHLRYIFRMIFDLMVAKPQNNLREYLSFGELIKKDIDARKRVFVLDGDSIEWSIIHAHAQRFIFPLHKDSRTTPRRGTRSNQTFPQQLVQLNL
jgi:hypothetical protein